MSQDLSNEIISAEIIFSNRDLTNQVSLSPDYQEQLNDINRQLEKYVNHADHFDYMIAVGSGILCGVFDSQIAGFAKEIIQTDEINIPGVKSVKLDPIKKQIGNKAKETLQTYSSKLLQHKGQASIKGMAASAIGECMTKNISGEFFSTDEITGEREINTGKLLEKFLPLLMLGLMKWLTDDRTPEEIEDSDLPEALKKLLMMLQKNPGARKFLRKFDLKKFRLEDLQKVGVPVIIIDLIKQNVPDADKKFQNWYKKCAKSAKAKLNDSPKISLSFLEKGMNQMVPVLLNEMLVRSFYFVRHFTEEYAQCGDVDLIDWEKVIPFDNRTIVRMMSIASLTFTTADMTDAAIRASIEAMAEGPIAAQNYFTRINIAGVGRAVLAVHKDVSMEWEEAELIRQRRLLAEQFRDEQVDALLEYRKLMEEAVETYLAEDLEAFLTGADEIEEGLKINDSDKVISGNVKIQRVLGREPQFTNQQEFDSLMSGEDALIL